MTLKRGVGVIAVTVLAFMKRMRNVAMMAIVMGCRWVRAFILLVGGVD